MGQPVGSVDIDNSILEKRCQPPPEFVKPICDGAEEGNIEEGLEVGSFKFQVSSFKFWVSGFEFQV